MATAASSRTVRLLGVRERAYSARGTSRRRRVRRSARCGSSSGPSRGCARPTRTVPGGAAWNSLRSARGSLSSPSSRSRRGASGQTLRGSARCGSRWVALRLSSEIVAARRVVMGQSFRGSAATACPRSRCQAPRNAGARFSRNAFVPSLHPPSRSPPRRRALRARALRRARAPLPSAIVRLIASTASGALRRDQRRDAARLGQRLPRRDDALDETDTLRLGCVDQFAGEAEQHRHPAARRAASCAASRRSRGSARG